MDERVGSVSVPRRVASAAGAEPQHGGSLTVPLGRGFAEAWPTGLDPVTNTTGGANPTQMNATYGSLFHLSAGGKGLGNPEGIPSLKTGYQFTDGGKIIEISLRKGAEFQDGHRARLGPGRHWQRCPFRLRFAVYRDNTPHVGPAYGEGRGHARQAAVRPPLFEVRETSPIVWSDV